MNTLAYECLPFWLRPLARREMGSFRHTFFCYFWAAAAFRYRVQDFAPLEDDEDLPSLLVTSFQDALKPWDLSEEAGYALFKALFFAQAAPSSRLLSRLADAWLLPEAAFLPLTPDAAPQAFDKVLSKLLMASGRRPAQYKSATLDLVAALQGAVPALPKEEVTQLAAFFGVEVEVLRMAMGFPRRSALDVALALSRPWLSLKEKLWRRKLPPEGVDNKVGEFLVILERQVLCWMRKQCRHVPLNEYPEEVYMTW